MREPIYLSKEGRIKLEKEIKRLKYTERPRVVAEIKRTREMGDLSENAEYHAAKEEQVYLEGKIAELEDKISRIQTVDKDQIPDDKVYLFAKVLVKDLKYDEDIEYTIVPPEEVDFENDMISVKSPIGAGLLGKAVGDKVSIEVPAGTINLEILKITRE